MITYFRRRYTTDAVQAVKVEPENVRDVAEWCRGRVIDEKDAQSSQIIKAVQFMGFGRVVRAYSGDYVVWDPRQGFFKKSHGEFFAEYLRVGENEAPEPGAEEKSEIKTDDPFEGMTRFSDD